ncbi:hypothetical protein BD779DRAFT_1678271 [Infundibulicybe gibba]|nr:hypothetical protein BD779DRAFT_1678271 [Infundibulicybe gibba]
MSRPSLTSRVKTTTLEIAEINSRNRLRSRLPPKVYGVLLAPTHIPQPAQLMKPQLLSAIPLLVRHLGSSNYTTYTYVLIIIDHVLSIKQNNMLLFAQADIREFAPESISTLLTKVEGAGTPRYACCNGRSADAYTSISNGVGQIGHYLRRRIKKPQQPALRPVYLWEFVWAYGMFSIFALQPLIVRRFATAGTPATLATFEQALFGPFTVILQQDIDQCIPYVFQMLAQMLGLRATSVPVKYHSLLPFLTPTKRQHLPRHHSTHSRHSA